MSEGSYWYIQYRVEDENPFESIKGKRITVKSRTHVGPDEAKSIAIISRGFYYEYDDISIIQIKEITHDMFLTHIEHMERYGDQ